MNTEKITSWSILLASAVGEEAAFRVMCMPAKKKRSGDGKEKETDKPHRRDEPCR